MPHSLSGYEYTFIKREHALFTSLVTLGASLLFVLPNFPLPVGFLGVCIASSIFHLVLYFLFDRITRPLLTLANIINLFMLALSVHYTGGVLSPFTMVFALVLISGAGYGVRMPVALGISIGLYCGVIIAEKRGYLPVVDLSPADIYRSWPATLFVLASVVGFMASSGSIYKVTVNNLRLKIARELEIRQSMANRLARLDAPSQIGLIVHKIVHDVNVPLSAVAGLLQLLKEEPSMNEQSREDCRIALRELGRANNLIIRMLKYVKPGQTGRERLCPRDLIETVLSVVSFLPGAKGISLTADLTPPGAYFIEANKEELQQVVFNILKNAIEAIPPSSPERAIRVRLSRDGAHAVIAISDSGPGIPKAMLTTVGRDMLSTKPQGSGIGLIIAREIIEAHDGTIAFESREGQGTSVAISIPIHGTAPEPKKQETHEKAHQR
jgi:signal transduction histidine kinase